MSNQAGCLSALGRREEALAAVEEAVTIRRQLAQGRPDAFLPDLVMSLNNVDGHNARELGERREQDGSRSTGMCTG